MTRGRLVAAVILTVTLAAPVSAAANDPREAAEEALLGIQFLSDNRGNVAETLGFELHGTARGTVVLDAKDPLPVYEILTSDLKHSPMFSAIKEEIEKEDPEAYEKYFKDAENLSDALSEVPPEELGDAGAFMMFMDIISGGSRERVLQKLGSQEPRQMVFRALKESDPRQITPVVVRRYSDPEDAGSERWRLFKVGQATLAKTLRCYPEIDYLLQVPELYLFFAAMPPAAAVPPGEMAEDCRPAAPEKPLEDESQCPEGSPDAEASDGPHVDDCLVAIYGFPDVFGVRAGAQDSLGEWLKRMEFLAKIWRGSPWRSLLLVPESRVEGPVAVLESETDK